MIPRLALVGAFAALLSCEPYGVVGALPASDAGSDAGLDSASAAEAGAAPKALPSPVFVRSWGGQGITPGQFIEPSSVELDSAGNVYVAGHEDRVQKFTSDGELIAIWGTGGTGDGQFNHPHGLGIDRRRGDIVYVGDQENRRVQAFTSGGGFVRTWRDDGFKHIHDVGIDPATGDIFVGDYEASIVQKFTADGRWLFKFGGAGSADGQFGGVWGISTDSQRNVYIADTSNRRIQKFDRDGKFLSKWDGSTLPAGSFAKPTGVFVDATDIIYVCDSLAQTVLLFDPAGKFLRSWDLRAITGFATEPEDIVVDPTGKNIYLGEVLGHRVLYLKL